MNTIIVAYDLNNPKKNYDCFFRRLKEYPNFGKFTRNCWFIKTEDSCGAVLGTLKPFMDKSDRLFVSMLDADKAWFNPICYEQFLKDI